MKHKVGLSCTPSKITRHEVIDVTEYLVSYGGGMGGASVCFYSKKLINSNPNNIEVELFDGEKMTIYNNFIVTERKKRLLKVVTDITKHVNYHKHVCDSKHEVNYYLINYGDDFEIVDEFISNSKLKIIDKYTF